VKVEVRYSVVHPLAKELIELINQSPNPSKKA